MKNISAIVVLLAATSAAAQGSDEVGEVKFLVQENSESCGFTFFTDGDDRLDLRGQDGRPCFDLKGGRDIFGLDPNNFPDGTDVFTGPGRDVVLLTDGADVVEAFDDEDEEIVLRGGNDIVRIRGVIAEGLARPGKSSPTLVKPGSGDDRLSFGLDGQQDVVRLRSPNIFVEPDGSGNLNMSMQCGRFADGRTIDLTVPSSGKEKLFYAELEGCGATFKRQASPLKLVQSGGRLNLSVRSPAYDLDHQPVPMDVLVEDGAGVSGSFEITSPQSKFDWQGYGVAALNLDLMDDRMGGAFDIESDETFYGTVNLQYGNATLNARAGEVAELVLIGGQISNEIEITLAARRVVLSWYPGAGTFPKVIVPDVVGYRVISHYEEAAKDDVISAIDESYMRLRASFDDQRRHRAGMALPYEGDLRHNMPVESLKAPVPYNMLDQGSQTEAFYSVQLTRPISRAVQTQVDSVDFRIHRSGEAGCFNVIMRDAERVLPERRVSCEDPVSVDDATNYEEVEVFSGSHREKIAINGSSGFRVDRLMLKN